jgi:hypothetical protein
MGMLIHALIAADPQAGSDARRDTRIHASAEVSLRPLGATANDARLLNISSLGFMAATDASVDPGSRIWLSLPGIPRINALVIWARDGKLGGEFAEPIDPLIVLQTIGLATSDAQA